MVRWVYVFGYKFDGFEFDFYVFESVFCCEVIMVIVIFRKESIELELVSLLLVRCRSIWSWRGS